MRHNRSPAMKLSCAIALTTFTAGLAFGQDHRALGTVLSTSTLFLLAAQHERWKFLPYLSR